MDDNDVIEEYRLDFPYQELLLIYALCIFQYAIILRDLYSSGSRQYVTSPTPTQPLDCKGALEASVVFPRSQSKPGIG